MSLVQVVKRYLAGKPAEATEVVHDKMRAIPPLTSEARRANYVKQNAGRPLTTRQLRQLRRKGKGHE